MGIATTKEVIMTKIKRIMASCLAAVSVAASLCVGAYAAQPTSVNWQCSNGSSHRISLYHSSAGCVAKMLGIMHTVPASSSITTVHCDSYVMSDYYIANYSPSEKVLKPDMGTTIGDVRVYYTVSVRSNTSGDTVTSYGVLEKY